MRAILSPLAATVVLAALMTLASLVAGSSAARANDRAPVPASGPPPDDAAVKHAKRTACLKDAKAKKLVGAQKAAFLKHCVATS
jgi:hypothetical protein